MRKVIKNSPRARERLERLPKIYLVAEWAKYGVEEHYFTNKFKVIDGISVPLVYDYVDFNGERDDWMLRPIIYTTTARIICWTQNKGSALTIAEMYQEKYGWKPKE